MGLISFDVLPFTSLKQMGRVEIDKLVGQIRLVVHNLCKGSFGTRVCFCGRQGAASSARHQRQRSNKELQHTAGAPAVQALCCVSTLKGPLSEYCKSFASNTLGDRHIFLFEKNSTRRQWIELLTTGIEVHAV